MAGDAAWNPGRVGSLVAAIVAGVFVLAPVASALDRSDRHSAHGFSLDPPSSFEARPVPADEPGLLAIYAPKKAPLDRSAPVTHKVFRIEFEGDGALAVRRWALGAFAPKELEPVRSVRRRYGRDPVRFEGAAYQKDGAERSLFVHGWIGPRDAIIFVGECDPDRWRRERRLFDRTAMSFRFFTEEELDENRRRWARHYRRSSLPHREERIDVAAQTVEGWAVRDTEHSIVLFHGRSDSPVLVQIARNLGAVRRQFAADFPPDRPIDVLSVVRVCRDRGEYLTYGGNPQTVGYFNPTAKELVLYDAREDRSVPMADDAPTMRTLYHEACHQFLHHTASSMSPHSWYDEGSAEYYAGSVMEHGAVTAIVELEDRRDFLRRPATQDRLPALASLLSMDQDTFYENADVNYSMGYAFIRFLRTSEAAAAVQAWETLPARYFESLRGGWRRQAEDLALSGITGAKYAAAQAEARSKALDEALEGVELDELEAAFLAWIVGSVQ